MIGDDERIAHVGDVAAYRRDGEIIVLVCGHQYVAHPDDGRPAVNDWNSNRTSRLIRHLTRSELEDLEQVDAILAGKASGGPSANGKAPGDGDLIGQLRAATIRSKLLAPADVDALPDPSWLVDSYIPAGGLAAVFGRPGSFKTFIALDWACSVASGAWWLGRPVQQGPVLYVMAEGTGGLRRRKDAWERGHQVSLSDFPLRVYPDMINMLDPEWVEGLSIVAADLGCTLTVIDTVSRVMPGGDENTGRDMGTLITAADRVRSDSGGAVLLVHHTPINGERLRGHSSLEGALDTSILCESDGTTVKVTVDKQKDDEPAPVLMLHHEQVADSLVLRTGSVANGKLPPDVRAVLRSLAEIEVEGGVSSSVWNSATNSANRTFYRARKKLIDDGLCQTVSGTEGSKNAHYQVSDTKISLAAVGRDAPLGGSGHENIPGWHGS